VQLDDVAIADGIATARFSGAAGDLPRTAQGQIVSTLAQFPTVRGVRVEVDGSAARLQDGAGDDLARPATGADYGDLTPDAFIFVRTPLRGATVSRPVRASGTANVFEATFQVEIWSGGKLVGTKTITATSGSGTRGTWAAVLDLPQGDARLVFFEPSANDGSHLHETEVLLHVR
jgi:germination protein M